TKLINLNPKLWIVYNNRGFSLNVLGRYEEAIEDLTQGIEIEPEFLGLYAHRGDAHRLLDNVEFSEKDYKTAIELFDQEDEKSIYCYKQAIRAERGLIKLGILKEGEIEQKL
ncbi:hypothetical protein HOI26_05330, partial [Candidatus Woesearchaeota archaeon]|nr:hypothetical protein [Candidatus Woesearchaeota archaeon]